MKKTKEVKVLENLVAYLDLYGEVKTLEAIDKEYFLAIDRAKDIAFRNGKKYQARWDEIVQKILIWGGSLIGGIFLVCFLTWAIITYSHYDNTQWEKRLAICTAGGTIGCMDSVRIQMGFDTEPRYLKNRMEIKLLKESYKKTAGKDLPDVQ